MSFRTFIGLTAHRRGTAMRIMDLTFSKVTGNLDLPLYEPLSGVERQNYRHILTDDGYCI
jgi:hypothetical protein